MTILTPEQRARLEAALAIPDGPARQPEAPNA